MMGNIGIPGMIITVIAVVLVIYLIRRLLKDRGERFISLLNKLSS